MATVIGFEADTRRDDLEKRSHDGQAGADDADVAFHEEPDTGVDNRPYTDHESEDVETQWRKYLQVMSVISSLVRSGNLIILARQTLHSMSVTNCQLQRRRELAYIPPRRNIPITANFRGSFICRFQSQGIGNSQIKMSVTKLAPVMPYAKVLRLMQCPLGSFLSQ